MTAEPAPGLSEYSIDADFYFLDVPQRVVSEDFLHSAINDRFWSRKRTSAEPGHSFGAADDAEAAGGRLVEVIGKADRQAFLCTSMLLFRQ